MTEDRGLGHGFASDESTHTIKLDRPVNDLQRMTVADRLLAALLLALVFVSLAVRPVWQVIDPGPSDMLRAHMGFQREDPVDPWGQPWIRTRWARVVYDSNMTELFEVASAGPDARVGTPDDIPLGVEGRTKEGENSILGVGPRPISKWIARSYCSSPAVPLATALILLLVRWVSGNVVLSGASLLGRSLMACGLALPATCFVVLVLSMNGAWELIEVQQFRGLVSPTAAAIGSIFLVLSMGAFAHRELHNAQKLEAAKSGFHWSADMGNRSPCGLVGDERTGGQELG